MVVHPMLASAPRNGAAILCNDASLQTGGQDTLTPAWKHIAGGCHLNRRIDGMVGEAGFRLGRLQTDYLPGPKPMTFMYEGCARPG